MHSYLRGLGHSLLAIAAAPLALADTGTERLQPFKVRLKQALVTGLQEGPENAVSVCKEQAPLIASELSVNGTVMGRSSHRLRNSENVSPTWVSDILSGYLEEDSDRRPATVTLPGNRMGYVEPIVLQLQCLVCHGSALAPPVAARIQHEYPHDQATGFEVGDLRGVYWVEFSGAVSDIDERPADVRE